MRNVPPETALNDALAAILDDLRETLGALRRPADLVAAEARLTEAREQRAERWEAYRAVVAEIGRSLARDPAGEATVRRAKTALDQAEGAVVRAQRSLARLREALGRTIGAAVARHREAAAAAVAGAADILAVAEAVAAEEHFKLPDVITYSAAILGVITAAHRAAVRQRNGTDREFSKAAADMAARAALPQPAAVTKWTGRPSELVRADADDGLTPIPIKPGSSTTTQRIPAAIANGAARAPAEPFRLSAAAVTATARLLRKR